MLEGTIPHTEPRVAAMRVENREEGERKQYDRATVNEQPCHREHLLP
jgi:hypothetical protein